MIKTKHKILLGVTGILALVGGILGAFSPSSAVGATPKLQVYQGGTGSSTLTGILYGNGISSVGSLTIGTNLSLSAGTLSASGGSGTGDSKWATTSTDIRPNVSGTGIITLASSTIQILNATTLTVPPLTSAITLTNGSGVFAEYAGTSCTNQFVRSLDALGAATCATVQTTDVASGIALDSELPVGANPSASVGLAAVNGSALTFMRSDGAPALAQNITPTWTGLHTFNTAGIISNASSSLGYLNSASSTITTLAIPSVLNSLLRTNGNGVVSAYAGTTCTNQFVRVLSVLGAATCATVGAADVSLANLTATDSTLTFSGTYTGATARTIGLTLSNANAWTALQTFNTAGIIATASSTLQLFQSTTATITNGIFSTILRAPYSATPSVATNGDIGVDSTSNQYKYQSGAATLVLGNGTINSAFLYPTTTMGTGTTTLRVAGFQTATTFSALSCTSRGGGTFVAVLGDSAASTTPVLSGTALTRTFTTLSSNNAFSAGEDMWYAIGSVSGAVTDPSCSYTRALTAD